MRRLALAALVVACRGGSSAVAVQDAEAPSVEAGPPLDAVAIAASAPVVERLVGNVVVRGEAMALLRELTDSYGPRVSGSPTHAAAARWAVDVLKKRGLEDARIEEFTLAHGWERREARAKVVAPSERTLHVASAGWYPATPDGGVRGEIVYPEDLSAEALKKAALRGKIVLVDKDTKTKNGRYLLGRALDPIAEAGALAVFNVQAFASNVHAAHATFLYKDLVGPLPMLDVGLEDGAMLRRLAAKGPVVVEASSPSVVTGPVQVPNVLAEIRGRERPDEWILVGAHLDAWDPATGAQDNGTGVAEVLEAARAIKALGAAPRRSIRFALWGGEEQGLRGSRAYVAAHAKELDAAVLTLTTDSGGGAPNGWHTVGRADVHAALKPLVPTLEGLGGGGLDERIECGSDHCSFALAGVPSLELDVDGSKYEEVHHLPSDTIDKVNASNVARAAAIVAATAWLAADGPTRVASRLTHDQVAAIVKKDAELASQLEYAGEFR